MLHLQRAKIGPMRVTLICVGKTNFEFVEKGVAVYERRLARYCKLESVYIPELKNVASFSQEQIKQKEGELILKEVAKRDAYAILLDEKGKSYKSTDWAHHLEKLTTGAAMGKEIVFVIGGAYGFSPDVYKASKEMLSLSAMTFSHQIIRVIFTEQLYRAFTIIKGEPYHHE